jgi:hypothetical protein
MDGVPQNVFRSIRFDEVVKAEDFQNIFVCNVFCRLLVPLKVTMDESSPVAVSETVHSLRVVLESEHST